MSDIPSFPYRLLWEERVIRSVANLTRTDAKEFLTLAADIPLRMHVQVYALADANQALDDLRPGVYRRCRPRAVKNGTAYSSHRGAIA